MKLSKRLYTVASLIDKNKRVIDVGCDHAYLDIYLTLNNLNNCLATDINKNAIKSAIENIKKYKLENKIEIKVTDGLKNIDVNKDDIIVISGMGTYTILDILNTNILSEDITGEDTDNNDEPVIINVNKGDYINILVKVKYFMIFNFISFFIF